MTTITWTCPLCGKEYKWMWPDEVKPFLNDMRWFPCDYCEKEYHMTLTTEGWKWDGDWRVADDR